MDDERNDEHPVTAGKPERERELLAVTVGEREPLNGTIHLAEYDPAWPSQFKRLARLVREALGERALLLEHVGSTSVPGLAAKPIIDMVLAVADSADEAAYVGALEAKGFTLRIREPDWHEHRLLKAPGIDGNLHVFSQGSNEIERMLRFRDGLRAHPDDRTYYDQTKRHLAVQTWKYTQNYADAKSKVVEEILARTSAQTTNPEHTE